MKKIYFILLVTIFIAAMIFSSCSKSSSTSTSTSTTKSTTLTSSSTTTQTSSSTSTTKSSTTTTKSSTTSTTTKSTTTTVNPNEPQYGGTLKILSTEKFYNIGDPRQSGVPNDGYVRHVFIETLLRFSWDPATRGEIVGWLCKSWEYNDALTTLTLKFQEGVKYHDGTDFNAASVKECWEMYIAAGLTQLNSVSSMDIVDTYTLRLNLKSFDVGLVGLFAQTPIGAMISPTAMKTYPKDKLINYPVGTGAFKFVSYEPGVKFVGERNPDYWVKGKPYLDSIEVSYMADSTVAKMAFERGEASLIPRCDVKQGSELMATGKYNVFISPAGFEFMLAGDTVNADSPFSNVNVRKAIPYAVNVDKMIDKLGYGLWQVARHSWNPAHWAVSPDPLPYNYNPDKARTLLREGGFADGFDTTLYLRDATFMDAMTVIQSYLLDVGIHANVKLMTSAEAAEQAVKGWHGIRHLLGPSTAEREPATTQLTYYGPGNIYNASLALPADVVALLQEESRTLDFEKRKSLAQQADKLIVDDYALIWQFAYVPFVVPKQKNVHDDNSRHFVGHYWTPEQAWLSE